jgi:hypothetical protein
MTMIDVKELESTYPSLYRTVKPYLGANGEVDMTKLPRDIAERLDGWRVLNDTDPNRRMPAAQRTPEQQPPAPPAPPQTIVSQQPPVPEYKDTFNEEMAALARKEGQRIRDGKEASARIEQWKSQGLQDTATNAQILTDWLDKNVKGYVSAGGIDAAVAKEGARGTNRLTWRKPTPAPRPPKPVEVLEPLPNGEQQLPLNSVPARHHSVAQLRDLDARQRAARGHSGGWYGTKF